MPLLVEVEPVVMVVVFQQHISDLVELLVVVLNIMLEAAVVVLGQFQIQDQVVLEEKVEVLLV
jgi:hypothetical protein